MRNQVLFHAIILGFILLCAFSPWLLMFVLSVAGVSGESVLEDLGLGIGYLGLAITPLGLLAAGIYLAAAIVFHFVFRAWRRASGKPATQGYLLAWSIIALSGVVLFIVYFAFVSTAQNNDEKGLVTPKVLKECGELVTKLPVSPWENGMIAIGIFSGNSGNQPGSRNLLLLNPDGSLNRSMPLQIDLHSLAWSPDGDRLALSDETNLYQLDLGKGEIRPVTHESPVENNASLITHPAWSPDGGTIYFEKRLGGEGIDLEIFALQSDGSNIRQLSDTPGYNISPRPSPDGAHIAFVSNRLVGPAIFMMDRDGTNVRQLSSGEAIDADPAWSPDGRWLAFLSNRGGTYQVFLLDVNNGQACQLTGTGMQPSAPLWSPDGTFILFHDQIDNQLVQVSPDGSDIIRWNIEKLKGSQLIGLDWAPYIP